MGDARIMPRVRDGDWNGLRKALNVLAKLALGQEASPEFGGVTLRGSLDMQDNPIVDLGYIDFNLINGVLAQEGRLIHDDVDGTLNYGLKGGNVNLQIGLEEVIRATNSSGGDLTNGRPVYVSGATGANPTIDDADADFAVGVGLRTVGLLTEDIDDGQKGYVTTSGYVRDIDTSMFAAEGMPVYLAVGGGFAAAAPAAPHVTYLLGIVIRKHATEGIVLVAQRPLPYLGSLNDLDVSGISDDQLIRWDSATSTYKNATATVEQVITFETYDAKPSRASESNIHGGLFELATAQPLDSVPTDIVVTKGIGKLMVVVNAGTDLAGEITVTGETIDRDTGVSTPADTDTLTIDALSTDGSTTDTNGNTVHSFTGAYITSKWFTGSVTLSTADLTLTDVDVYHVSFEQGGDFPSATLQVFDANIFTTNIAAEFDAYAYVLQVTGDKCDITNEADLHVGADGETAIANRYWRLRRGGLNVAFDGTTDGLWADVHYSNPAQAYVEDVTLKLIGTVTRPLILT